MSKLHVVVLASMFAASSMFAGTNGSCEKPCKPKCEPKPCKPNCEPKPCTPPCPQPVPPTQVCPGQDPCCPPWATPVLNAAYNYPAHTMVRCSWDIYADATFTYWQPIQENMEFGYSEENHNLSTEPFDSDLLSMDFDYKPGFKVGIGGYFDYDNWDLNGEYTWFHGTQNTHATAPEGGAIFPTKSAFNLLGTFVDFFEHIYNPGNVYNTAKKKWNLRMDIAEVDLGRWYYVGTKLTFRPSVGLRAAFIRQDAKTTYVNDGTLTLLSGGIITTTTADTNVIKQESHSWALGPQFALDTNWMIGKGFRMYSTAEVDSLFTRYTKSNVEVKNYVTASGAEIVASGYSEDQEDINSVRTHLELELGFGWGTYFDCNNWYADFAVGYTFQSFFDQNVFRNYLLTGVDLSPTGNLYLQGLNVKFKLDF